MEKETIYKLELHETIEINCGAIIYFVTRVPGGWIYKNIRPSLNSMTSVFVHYDNEFTN